MINNPALNQARRIIEWADVPQGSALRGAVERAWLTGDTTAGLAALRDGRAELGVLGYMVDELELKVQRDAIAPEMKAA